LGSHGQLFEQLDNRLHLVVGPPGQRLLQNYSRALN